MTAYDARELARCRDETCRAETHAETVEHGFVGLTLNRRPDGRVTLYVNTPGVDTLAIEGLVVAPEDP